MNSFKYNIELSTYLGKELALVSRATGKRTGEKGSQGSWQRRRQRPAGAVARHNPWRGSSIGEEGCQGRVEREDESEKVRGRVVGVVERHERVLRQWVYIVCLMDLREVFSSCRRWTWPWRLPMHGRRRRAENLRVSCASSRNWSSPRLAERIYPRARYGENGIWTCLGRRIARSRRTLCILLWNCCTALEGTRPDIPTRIRGERRTQSPPEVYERRKRGIVS